MKNQYFSTLLLITLLFWGISVFGQKHTVVVYRYNQDSLKNDAYYLPLWKIFESKAFGENKNYPGKFISFNKKGDYSETIYDYSIKDTTCLIIAETFGHQTFVIPGDTLIMNIGNKIPRPVNKLLPIMWSRNLTHEGKNKFVSTLFDSLQIVTGDLRFTHIPFAKTDPLGSYCENVHNMYIKRISFLEQYCNRHAIANSFKKLAIAEIEAAYIAHLITPMEIDNSITINDYPKPYSETLSSCKFNDPTIYFKTVMYSGTAYSIARFILQKDRTNAHFTEKDIKILYQTIKLSYSDSIRNHLLTLQLSSILKNTNITCTSFDSLYTNFKSICRNQLYTHYLDSLNVVRKQFVAKKYTLKEAMESQIINGKDQVVTVKQLFKKKPVLIICWASWCEPCLKEISSEKNLQDKYGDKVDFIYLSFDISKKPWQDKLQTLSIKDGYNYLLTNINKSNFNLYYEISTIPRYLLYDKNGNKVETKDLRPSNDGFKDILEKLIQ